MTCPKLQKEYVSLSSCQGYLAVHSASHGQTLDRGQDRQEDAWRQGAREEGSLRLSPKFTRASMNGSL